MRPHQLRVCAFGPFAGEVTVDFDAMAAGGLFLLQGDTGAGKTSILDALAFALYGRVPGQRAGAGRLRSDHAAPDDRTCVELEVTLGRRRLRVTRWPEQERARKRGSGTTRDPAKVLLQEAVDGGWQTLSTRVGEADAELSGLLGMSADQFHQVVLLPQGEFARFLRSDAGERARLLQRLFSTDRFRRVEEWLADRRRRCAADLDAAVADVRRLASRVAQAAGVADPAVDGSDRPADAEDAAGAAGAAGSADDRGPSGVPTPGWAEALAVAAADAAAQATRVTEGTRTALQRAERDLAVARDRHRRQERRAELVSRSEALEADRLARVALAGRVDAARRAAEVRSDLDQAVRRRRTADALVATVATGRAQLAPLGLAEAEPPALRADADRRRRALGRLDHAGDLERELTVARRRNASALRAAEVAAVEGRARRSELEHLPERRAELRRRAEEAIEARVELPAADAAVRRLERAAQDVRARALAVKQQQVRREENLSARERALASKEEATRLRNERVDSMIAELSAALLDGDPCPVCGATEHPDPSDVRGSRVTREQEDAARTAADTAQQEVAALAAALARLDAEIDALEAQLADAGVAGRSPQEVAEAGRLAAARRDDLRRRAAVAEDVDGQLRGFELLERQAVEALALADRNAAAEQERAAEAAERAAELGRSLEEVLQGASSVDAARAAEQGALAQIERMLELHREAQTATAEAEAGERAAVAAAEAAGFPGVDEARAALLAPQELAGLVARLDEAQAAEVAVRAGLADPELDPALDPGLAVPADVSGHAAALERCRADAQRAAAAAALASSRADELAALVPVYTREVTALEPLHRRAAEVRQIADLAAGQGANRLKMTLSAYVLAARLEEVAAVASERLRRMTQGRYTLVHTDAGRGNGRAGLGLLVQDAWTGQDRDTATLSGGETFLASLALALALGDVVTAEAGGADIDALFVDEGFGSLDEQTLDEVMDTLDGLREGGRLVGLVSHVGELRMRIPAQIHVQKGRAGSTVTVVPG